MLNFGQPLKTDLVNLPVARTIQQEVFNARNLKHSLNKRLELGRAAMQKGQKQAEGHCGAIKVP